MVDAGGWLLVIFALVLASGAFALAAVRLKQKEAASVGRTQTAADARATNGAVAGQIIANEKATWEAAKKKDEAILAALLADNYKEVSDSGVQGKADALRNLEHGAITNYWMDDVRVAEHDRRVAVITYKVRIEGIYQGQPFPPKYYYTTSIWMNRNGKWQAVLTWAPN